MPTAYTKTTLPVEVDTTDFANLPYADIENDYNIPLRVLKELWAVIDGTDAGTDANGVPLQDYTGIGLLDKLNDIMNGKMNAPTSLTIASDIITVTGFYHVIDTQAAAATDDLVTINGGTNTRWLILRTANSARDVVIKNTGNITTPGGLNVTLDTTNNIALLIYNNVTTKWDLIYTSTPIPATETAAGVVELATDAETITGTSTTHACTPANVQAKINALSAAGLVPIASSGALSGVASYEVTNGTYPSLFDGTYSSILFVLINAKPASDGVDCYMTVSSAAAYLAGTNYELAQTGRTSAGSGTGSDVSTGAAQWIINGDNGVGNNTNEGVTATVQIFKPNATVYRNILVSSATIGTSTTLTGQAEWGTLKNTGALDKIKFTWSGGGNWAGGEVHVYGMP